MSGLRRRAARSTDGDSGRWRSQGRGHDLRHGERSSRSIHNNHERHAYGDDHNAAKQQDPFGLHRRAQDGGQMMGTMPAVGMSGKPAPRQPSRPPALIRYIGAARCAGAPATLPPSAISVSTAPSHFRQAETPDMPPRCKRAERTTAGAPNGDSE
jgi:hypothetical protein